MGKPAMIQDTELPAPDTVIDYGEAGFGPLFLHWMPEGGDIGRACGELGFDCQIVPMEFDLEPEHPLWIAYYEEGDAKPVRDWEPTPPDGEGWQLVGQWDQEDGPVALFIRKPMADDGAAA